MKQYKVTPIAHTSRAYKNMMVTWLIQYGQKDWQDISN